MKNPYLIFILFTSLCSCNYFSNPNSDNSKINCMVINGINWSFDSERLLFACSPYGMPGAPSNGYFSILNLSDMKSTKIAEINNSTLESPVFYKDGIISYYCANANSNQDDCGIWQMYPEKRFLLEGLDVSINPINNKLLVVERNKNELRLVLYDIESEVSTELYDTTFAAMFGTAGMDWKNNIVVISIEIFQDDNNDTMDIYYINLLDNKINKISNGLKMNFQPSISPDNKYISYCGGEPGRETLHIFNIEESKNIAFPEYNCVFSSWSPSGQKIAIAEMATKAEILDVNKLLNK